MITRPGMQNGYRAPYLRPTATIRDVSQVVMHRPGAHYGEHPGASVSTAETPNERACQQRTLTVSVVSAHGERRVTHAGYFTLLSAIGADRGCGTPIPVATGGLALSPSACR